MVQRRSILMFIGRVAILSFGIAALLWNVPQIGSYNVRSDLTMIPLASMILAASGATWRRRATFVALLVAVSLAVDAIFLSLFKQYLLANTVLSSVYVTQVVTGPVVVFIFFLRKDPSMLWTPRSIEPTGVKRRPKAKSRRK